MPKKTSTMEEADDLAGDLLEAHDRVKAAWTKGMRRLPIKSLEYQRICQSGRRLSAALMALEDRVSPEMLKRMHRSMGCGWG